ncbi:MAG: C4-type zinc ribbon domain-containing protein [Candidatus Krumholzibacteria bacterium]|jgi:predicted  nucleic acid-binding Zn-ribbon protein|nr:C4-type zinc ribbon domain-containing protein [Candidatus Krumholzibacteria bacterium]MDH4338563.1 C4-type zinc ribbon domain-containing protein [Candidatus Krumholzibacteria bacterium]MDH5271245.1 C4-type zinc ribbon domain-containing protein [Candidatus Krumholzibacteria bacterium]
MNDLRRDISLFVSVARIEASLHSDRLALQRIPTEIETIDRALAGLEAREKAARARLDGLLVARRDTEKRLHEHEDHLKKCKSQQSLVKTNDEYTAMIKEIANLEKAIGDDEEKILVLMDEIEAAEKETAAAHEALQVERGKRMAERDTLEAKSAELATEVDRLTREKPKILSEISPALLKRYERVADRFGDLAVTRVQDEHCGVCRQQLPPQVAVEVRKNDQFITCQACGRILVYYAD